jgi:hypothetical protein
MVARRKTPWFLMPLAWMGEVALIVLFLLCLAPISYLAARGYFEDAKEA